MSPRCIFSGCGLLFVLVGTPGSSLGLQAGDLPCGVASEASAGQRVLVWTIGRSVFRAAPESGARLLAWEYRRADGSLRPVIHRGNESADGNPAQARGGIPVLFPFAGPSETNGRKLAWRDAHGVVRPMPMHGLARQGRFALTELRRDGFRAEFRPGPEAQESYPFRYTFTVDYRFTEDRLLCELELRNEGDEPLPWSAGLHPYFPVPWQAGRTRDDYEIMIPATLSWRRSGAALVPGPDPVFPGVLADAALRTIFWSGLKAPDITFGPAAGKERIRLTLGPDLGALPGAAVILWTEKEAAPFFCVEPFMGPSNAAEHGCGLHVVPPGGREVFRVEIRME